MRILLSAFACLPGKGSEPEVGLRALVGAAEHHDVWVLTDVSHVDELSHFLSSHRLRDRIRVEGIGPSAVRRRGGLLGLVEHHVRHDAWQRRAARRAVELDAEVDFDVVHHVTYATYWTRAGVAEVDKPLLWGPVGGGTEPPLKLFTEVGLRGAPEALARIVLRRLAARRSCIRSVQQRASLTFAQTRATAEKLRYATAVEQLTNATSVDLSEVALPKQRTSDLVFAGRLVSWKAGRLAIRSMRYLQHPTAVLRVFGDGPDMERMQDAARRWDVTGRVRFEGRVPREELLSVVAAAGAVLHPSLHDEAALSVAEALALGTPLICLDHGGPAALCDVFSESPSTTIAASWPDGTARALAHAADMHLVGPAPIPSDLYQPRRRFAPSVLEAYDRISRSPSQRSSS